MPLRFSYSKNDPPSEPVAPKNRFSAAIVGDKQGKGEARLLGAQHDGHDVNMGEMDEDLTVGLTEHEARILCSNLARSFMLFAGAGAMMMENTQRHGDGGYLMGVGSFTMYRQVMGSAMKAVDGKVCGFEKLLEANKQPARKGRATSSTGDSRGPQEGNSEGVGDTSSEGSHEN